MTSHFVRVPPDSTGKRVAQLAYAHFPYVNKSAPIAVGDVVTTASGLIGVVTKIVESSPTVGHLHVLLSGDSTESFASGENLLIDAAPVAQTSATVLPFYTQNMVNVGANEPNNGQFVDNRGAAFTRFTEGSPMFDGFGGLKVNESTMSGVYEFANDPMDDLFTKEEATGGTVTYDNVKSLVSLNVTTSNGSSAIRTSNKYHFYWPGVSTTLLATIGLSDTGVANNTRQWGLFDENNGMFFEVVGTTVNVVLRSKVSGAVVETRIPQSDWNSDNLDGTGLSGVTLNVSKLNVYWIDFQWLGGGRVRFGIYREDGVRTLCHEFRNAGSNDYPYMQNGSLPWRVANFNTALIGSTPSIRNVCAAIRTDGKLDYTYWRWAHTHPSKAITTSNEPLMSMRSKNTYNSNRNVVNAYPEKYNCIVTGTGAIKLDFAWPIALTGATFAVDDDTTVEFDHAATAGTIDASYWQLYTVYLNPGVHSIDLTDLFNANDEGVIRGSTATPPQVPFSVVASLVSGTPTIEGTLSYKELR